MNTNTKLYPISVWEKLRSWNMVFEHVFYTKKREVRLVKGFIQQPKKIIIGGKAQYKNIDVKVRWDSYGHCWLGATSQKRKRDFDITLE